MIPRHDPGAIYHPGMKDVEQDDHRDRAGQCAVPLECCAVIWGARRLKTTRWKPSRPKVPPPRCVSIAVAVEPLPGVGVRRSNQIGWSLTRQISTCRPISRKLDGGRLTGPRLAPNCETERRKAATATATAILRPRRARPRRVRRSRRRCRDRPGSRDLLRWQIGYFDEAVMGGQVPEAFKDGRQLEPDRGSDARDFLELHRQGDYCLWQRADLRYVLDHRRRDRLRQTGEEYGSARHPRDPVRREPL